MGVDFPAALRAVKPERKTTAYAQRAAGAFVHVSTLPVGSTRRTILLDTNIYILDAAGTLPAAASAIVDQWLKFHSSVCLAEIATGLAAYHPSARGYAATRRYYEGLMAAIPDSRILTPDSQTWLEAGLVAGALARTQGLQPYQRKDLPERRPSFT